MPYRGRKQANKTPYLKPPKGSTDKGYGKGITSNTKTTGPSKEWQKYYSPAQRVQAEYAQAPAQVQDERQEVMQQARPPQMLGWKSSRNTNINPITGQMNPTTWTPSPYTGPNPAYPYPLNYRYGIAPDEYAPRMLQMPPNGQMGTPSIDDMWSMYALSKASQNYPMFTPKLFGVKQAYEDYYSRLIERVGSMYQPAYSNRGNVKADAMNDYTKQKKFPSGKPGTPPYQRYLKLHAKEAQGTTSQTTNNNQNAGNEGGNGWYDWGGGGGDGGGGYSSYANYYQSYRPGSAEPNAPAQPVAMRSGYQQQPYGNGYATQNGAQRWLQLLTNWRI